MVHIADAAHFQLAAHLVVFGASAADNDFHPFGFQFLQRFQNRRTFDGQFHPFVIQAYDLRKIIQFRQYIDVGFHQESSQGLFALSHMQRFDNHHIG